MFSPLKYLAEYKKETILAPFFKLLEACIDLMTPLVVAVMIDRGLGGGDRRWIWFALVALVSLAFVGMAMAFTAQYFAARAASGFASNLRRAAFARIQRLTFAQIDRFGADSLATRLTSDVNQVQTGVNLILRLFMRSPVIVFGATIMAFVVDPHAALVFLIALPALAAVVFSIVLATLPLYALHQRRLDAIALASRENLAGVRVVRAFNMEETEKKRFSNLSDALLQVQKRAGAIAGAMNPATYLIVNLAIVALLACGAARVDSGFATQGETVALVNYMSQILVELIKLANLIVQSSKSLACARRVAEILDEPEGMRDGSRDVAPVAPGSTAVAFHDVSFAYPGASGNALEGVTFDAKAGQIIGIIGGTGSGKSTLVNLIPRFYDATRGVVAVMGEDVRDCRLARLRGVVGVTPQKAELFSGTIRSNLCWGAPDADDARLMRALEIAQARDFVEGKPGGLDAIVEQNGRNFSGGQRQRLTIARALVREPEILILDDASSALDYATDAKLRRALRESRPASSTTFIVAQRAASVCDADLILVLDGGRVVGSGTHAELLRDCEIYQEIYYSQFPEEKEEGRE